jgi:hypothetical protein
MGRWRWVNDGGSKQKQRKQKKKQQQQQRHALDSTHHSLPVYRHFHSEVRSTHAVVNL